MIGLLVLLVAVLLECIAVIEELAASHPLLQVVASVCIALVAFSIAQSIQAWSARPSHRAHLLAWLTIRVFLASIAFGSLS